MFQFEEISTGLNVKQFDITTTKLVTPEEIIASFKSSRVNLRNIQMTKIMMETRLYLSSALDY